MNRGTKNFKRNWLKLGVGLVFCLLFRLFPFRVPNIELILATQMPFSKAYGSFAAFLFGFLSIVLYDVSTGTLGKWTFLTSISYGIIGFWSAYYFKNREPSAWNFVRFAVISTIFFDAVTGLLTGPLFFNQSFYAALVGQVPFTALHLIGNVAFALVLSPVIYSFAIKKKKTNTTPVINILNPKTI